jgi:hypothetical protein
MPLSPRERFYKRLVQLGQQRQSVPQSGHLSISGRANSAVEQLRYMLERKIRRPSAILKVQREVTDLFAHVAYGLNSSSAVVRGGQTLPTRNDLSLFVCRDVTKLIFLVITTPHDNRDAARKAYEQTVIPLLRRAIELLTPLSMSLKPAAAHTLFLRNSENAQLTTTPRREKSGETHCAHTNSKSIPYQ